MEQHIPEATVEDYDSLIGSTQNGAAVILLPIPNSIRRAAGTRYKRIAITMGAAVPRNHFCYNSLTISI
jgi:hypothetical protein